MSCFEQCVATAFIAVADPVATCNTRYLCARLQQIIRLFTPFVSKATIDYVLYKVRAQSSLFERTLTLLSLGVEPLLSFEMNPNAVHYFFSQ